ncbi:MAG: hypothetical protein R2713_02735 [Ilumatobacteraceae bacterium]
MTEQADFVESNYTMIDLDKPGPLQDALRALRAQQGDRPSGADRPHRRRPAPGGQRPVLARPGGPSEDRFDPSQDVEGAQALIDEYLAENPGPIQLKYGTTVSAINAQVAELLTDYWSEIGVETDIVQIPQDQYITKALFGDPDYDVLAFARRHVRRQPVPVVALVVGGARRQPVAQLRPPA